LLKEKLTFGNRTFDGMFGAIYEAAGTFSATYQVDGILGLSYFSDLSVPHFLHYSCASF
jgi:hypothetical protein